MNIFPQIGEEDYTSKQFEIDKANLEILIREIKKVDEPLFPSSIIIPIPTLLSILRLVAYATHPRCISPP